MLFRTALVLQARLGAPGNVQASAVRLPARPVVRAALCIPCDEVATYRYTVNQAN
jgi:hypothetical protein